MMKFFMLIFLASCSHVDWRTADRSSMGIAPTPSEEKEAIVQVYVARAINWRGYFAVHSWIATKERNADEYTTYHVMGFRLKRTGTSVVIENDIPDRKWFGADAEIIQELKGNSAEKAIEKIKAIVPLYPYANSYRAYPGPNSNTFISYILRNVDELGVELPPHAIGKDWPPRQWIPISATESGTGFQFSLFGLLGFSLGLAEGIELNILGLNLGLDFYRPALKLPLYGRLGFEDAPIFTP